MSLYSFACAGATGSRSPHGRCHLHSAQRSGEDPQKPGLVSLPKVLSPGSGRVGARRKWQALGTRLTCSAVGVRVPGFLVKHQGAFGSDHPHERRNFAARRQGGHIFSCTTNFCWDHSQNSVTKLIMLQA
jgi:hypothetical protein